MTKLKTGEVIGKKNIGESKLHEYEALIFIKDIPTAISDDQLKIMLDLTILKLADKCEEIIVRAILTQPQMKSTNSLKG